MATGNKFLAPKLQSPSVKGRTAATFTDNRTKTITPLPYIETIMPGKNGVSGIIGETDSSGNFIPEPNAYIYIYINGFLLNPPSLNADGTFNNDKTSVISLKDGTWSTSAFFFSVLPEFQFGQVITFRAKAPFKQISDRTVPYMIGGMPAPIDLGIYGDNGILRPPYEGESSIMGRVSYWMRHVDEQGVTVAKAEPLFDCSNRIFVYVDGVHAGTSGNTIGEIFKNEIRGTDASFPFSNSLENQTLSLIVDKSQVNIPLIDLQPIDSAILIGTKDGVNGQFSFLQPSANLGFKIFKNGVRLTEGYDYQYKVNANTNLGLVNFNVTNVIPVPADRLDVLFQYQAGSFVIGELVSGTIDGSNDTFVITQTPRAETFELYRNGLHLIQGTDYTISGTVITMDATQIPEVGELLVADYQPATAKNRYVFVEELTTDIGTADEFLFSKPNIIGNPHVFRNGILQHEGLFNDYTIVRGNVIKFNPWAKPEEEDKLLVTFYVTPVLLSQIVDYLNQTTQFKENCLFANTLNVKPIINYHRINNPDTGLTDGVNKYFTLPVADIPTNLRLFVNGIRQKESSDGITGDYFIDYAKGLIAFLEPPERGSSIVGLMNYITTDFVVGETPKGQINGGNSIFTLALIPKANTVQVFYNGVRLSPFGQPDYSVTQNQLTFLTFIPSEGDTILVDYEVAFGSETFTSTIVPQGGIDGYNGKFTFPTPEVGTAVNVYKNGLLQQPEVDYILDRTSIQFSTKAPPYGTSVIPIQGDKLLVEFNNAFLFTNNPNDQLRISSPYPLDIKRYKNNVLDFAQSALFGSGVELYPGKDEDGEFRFWFNRRTGYWKWTWYDPFTGITTPFTTGQRITARALNNTPFIYKKKR